MQPSVRIVEVGPRDGLQNVKTTVSTKVKTDLIRKLIDCGLSTVEVTSCVSPKWVPQLADNRQVLADLRPLLQRADLILPVLVPNVKGLDAAVRGGAREVAVFVSASEGFSRKNTNCSIDEALARSYGVLDKARSSGIRVRGYVSCITHCPYDGRVSPEAVLRVSQALLSHGCYEISLGDTVGMATSADVEGLLSVLLRHIPPQHLAGHFHDTYGQAVANALKAYEMGIRVFDSSVAGLGGCPYAKGAKGNVATEDLVYAFHGHGVATGVDLTRLSVVGAWISQQLGIKYESRAGASILAKMPSPPSSTTTTVLLTKPKGTWATLKSTPDLSVTRRGPDVKFTLMRPKQGNTLTAGMLHDLTSSLSELAKDKTVFRIIIAGTGKFFCTGMDLSSSGATTSTQKEQRDAQFRSLKSLFDTLSSMPQVSIACINGPCFGGGVGLALVCDVRVAAPSASLTLSETKLGLAPAVISKYVIRELGYSVARNAMVSAKTLTVSELHRWGVIHEVSETTEALDSVLEEALSRLSLCAPRASALSKEMVNIAWAHGATEHQDGQIKKTFDEMMGSPEATYGITQFRNKNKKVDWEGFYLSNQAVDKAKL